MTRLTIREQGALNLARRTVAELNASLKNRGEPDRYTVTTADPRLPGHPLESVTGPANPCAADAGGWFCAHHGYRCTRSQTGDAS